MSRDLDQKSNARSNPIREESKQPQRPIGLHVSISGHLNNAVQRAIEAGCCGTFQIFTCSPRRWNAASLKEEEVRSFRHGVSESGFEVFCHMPYLPNLSSPDPSFYDQSVSVLVRELQRCTDLGIDYLVVHLGSHMGTTVEDGQEKLINACRTALGRTDGSRVMLLLENSAGTKNSVGSSFEHLGRILEGIGERKRVGVCFDTCHAFAAGYDLRTEEAVNSTMEQFKKVVGFERLRLIHFNDSKGELGGARDRHENIGKGKIGLKGMKAILKYADCAKVPVVLETPIVKEGDDRKNLSVAKSLLD